MPSFASVAQTIRKRYCTTLFISKVLLIILNACFITVDLIVSTYLWLNIYHLASVKVDLPQPVVEEIVFIKRCGIILTNAVVITISTLGLIGAIRGAINVLILYHFFALLSTLVLMFGWRNYVNIWQYYLAVIFALLVALVISLVNIKTIKDEPYRIRRQLLVNMHQLSREP